MEDNSIIIEKSPELHKTTLIAGFEGWGNALNISNAMLSYLIRKLKAEPFARINPDHFYRYDENRPVVDIEDGILKTIDPPGGLFYTVDVPSDSSHLVLLKGDEPNLKWFRFAEDLSDFFKKLNISTFVSLGSMYDNVLHTDRIVSGFASKKELSSLLTKKNILQVNYNGPSSIHSILHSECRKRDISCASLWCHCPYYLQGTTHYGLLSHIGEILSYIGNFSLDTEDLDKKWIELNQQIQSVVENNPELQKMIDELRKAKVRGSWEKIEESIKKNGKVIPISDFMKPA